MFSAGNLCVLMHNTKSKWRWSTYDKLMKRSGFCYPTFPTEEGLTKFKYSNWGASAGEPCRKGSPCPDPLAPPGQGCWQTLLTRTPSPAPAMNQLLCPGQMQGHVIWMLFCARRTGKGLWTKRRLMLHQWCLSRLQLSVGKMLKERGTSFFFYCL